MPNFRNRLLIFSFVALFFSCSQQKSLHELISSQNGLNGRTNYLASPYLTAGDRLYLVGFQNGSFPDLGWHIPGEMGGIWDHPIKLADGFDAEIACDGQILKLDSALKFINYPIGNKHLFGEFNNLTISRVQFVPDAQEAIIIEYQIKNTGEKEQEILFKTRPNFDLRPTWLGDSTGMLNAPDLVKWDENQKIVLAKDEKNPWFACFGSNQGGKYSDGQIINPISLKPGEIKAIRFCLSGSYHTEKEAIASYEYVIADYTKLFEDKSKRFTNLKSITALNTPDSTLNLAFEWLKYNTDWLIREVPEIGRGITAGMPDYPWWFGVDSEYTLKGLIAMGRKDLVYETIDLIYTLSEKRNGNGKIIHEVSTNGFVFNPGNINETPQFVSLIKTVYDWTGDRQFLKKYYQGCKKGLEWLLKENDKDGNLLPDGFGMMEIHGLNSEMTDVAAYTQRAFSDMAFLAGKMNEIDIAKSYSEKAEILKNKINTEFWVEDFKSYADFIGTVEQADKLIEDAILRANELKKPWAVTELKETKKKVAQLRKKYGGSYKTGFVLHHNWVVNTPMEMGIADSSKAIEALETGSHFVNPFGMFVTGIDRDDAAANDTSSAQKKIFSYTGAVMTLPTGVQAIAENNYGRPDKALGYINRMLKSFGWAFPGSIYEVSPDFGMMTQAWNAYAIAYPVITQIFGIKPAADEKKIYLNPVFPETWPYAELNNIQVGDTSFSIKIKRKNKGLEIEIEQKDETWGFVLPQQLGALKCTLANNSKPLISNNQLEIKGKSIIVRYQ